MYLEDILPAKRDYHSRDNLILHDPVEIVLTFI